jgi:hypothetical protein
MAIKSPASGVVVCTRFLAITPSNSTQYGRQANPVTEDICAIWVGGLGALNLVDQDGNTTLIAAVPAGTLLPISPFQILSTSTTASSIVALYW